MGFGISHGAITVLNAMPTGIGATVGTELFTKAEFSPDGDCHTVRINNDPDENTAMACYCVEKAYSVMGMEEPSDWTLDIDSNIPISRGLKSSSSACNAILHSVFDHYSYDIEPVELVRHGVSCAKRAGVTVTGSFDDACGCELGGLVMTNNRENNIIGQTDIDAYDVVIYVPDRKIRKNTLDVEMLHSLAPKLQCAIDIAVKDPWKAMVINGRIISEASGVDNSVAEKALEAGAIGAGMSGSGPAIAMVFEEGKGKQFADTLTDGQIILTRTRGRSI